LRHDASPPRGNESVLAELQNRGVADVLVLVRDGLKGPPEAVNAAFPATNETAALKRLT